MNDENPSPDLDDTDELEVDLEDEGEECGGEDDTDDEEEEEIIGGGEE